MSAQVTMTSVYSLSSDTVKTNDSIVYLTSPRVLGPADNVLVEIVGTKISGTVGGVISLQGSINESQYKAILLEGVSTALNTYTATNVSSQTFIFVVPHNPYLRYRILWSGTGTMSAKFTAKVFLR